MIRDYIRIIYNANYIGSLIVEKFDGNIYRMSIAIPHYMFPTTIAGEFMTDESFLDYVYEELRIRNYMRVYFYKVVRTQNTREE